MGSFEGRPHSPSQAQNEINRTLGRIDKGERKLQYRDAYQAELWPLREQEEHLKLDLEVAEWNLEAAKARARLASLSDPKHAAREAARAYIAESKREVYMPQPAPVTPTQEMLDAGGVVTSIKEQLAAVSNSLAEKDRELRARFGLTPED